MVANKRIWWAGKEMIKVRVAEIHSSLILVRHHPSFVGGSTVLVSILHTESCHLTPPEYIFLNRRDYGPFFLECIRTAWNRILRDAARGRGCLWRLGIGEGHKY